MQVWGKGRGQYESFHDEDGNDWLWALCEVENCQNYVCHRMNDRFCWPHLMSGGCVALKTQQETEPTGKN